jgi:hypothetical protein
MTIRVANTDFDRVDYDADGNVLYLPAGDPERVVGFEETQEGDAVRYAHCGELVGITTSTPVACGTRTAGSGSRFPQAISAAVLRPALIGAEERSSGWLRWVTSGQRRVPNDAVRCRSVSSRKLTPTQAFWPPTRCLATESDCHGKEGVAGSSPRALARIRS